MCGLVLHQQHELLGSQFFARKRPQMRWNRDFQRLSKIENSSRRRPALTPSKTKLQFSARLLHPDRCRQGMPACWCTQDHSSPPSVIAIAVIWRRRIFFLDSTDQTFTACLPYFPRILVEKNHHQAAAKSSAPRVQINYLRCPFFLIDFPFYDTQSGTFSIHLGHNSTVNIVNSNEIESKHGYLTNQLIFVNKQLNIFVDKHLTFCKQTTGDFFCKQTAEMHPWNVWAVDYLRLPFLTK